MTFTPVDDPTAGAKPVAVPLPLRHSREIQGDVLAGFKKDHVQLLFLKFEDAQRGRDWLRKLRHRVATTKQVATFNEAFSRARRYSGGDDPKNMNALWRGVSFTCPGLKLLAGNKEPFPSPQENSTQQAFAQGPSERAGKLGDTGDNAPEKWLFGNGKGQVVHAVLTVAADQAKDLRAALGEERQEAANHKIVIVFEQHGATLEGERRGKEHFGFKDGISEPGVVGFDPPQPGDEDHVLGKPGTRRIPAGEFVIGEECADGTRPAFPEWARNGSFQVIRRLGQDVPGWWGQVGAHLKELRKQKKVPDEATAEWLAARLVGRWRSGTPVAKCPYADSLSDAEAWSDNDISYAGDLDGEITPLYSHLRKTSPRDGLAFNAGDKPVPEKGPGGLDGIRIMRRGIPYGLPFDPAGGEGNGPDAKRGLLFVSYQGDLVRQFEFIQKSWVNSEDFPKRVPKVGNDPMIGLTTEISFRGSKPLTFEQFVRTEGALYAFVPSMSTLDRLADGKLDDEPPAGVDIKAPYAFDRPITTARTSFGPEPLGGPDATLVVTQGDARVWSSGGEKGGVRAAFEEDGNLVVYKADGSIAWQSAPAKGGPNATLTVHPNGNVAIYPEKGKKPVWQTGTTL